MADNMSEELREKLRACKTAEELEAVANEAGIELSDEMLQSVAGGRLYGEEECPPFHTCTNYCQNYVTVDGMYDCTWVSGPAQDPGLICATHTTG